MLNVFAMNPDALTTAGMHCDQHVLRMLGQYTQILCNAVRSYILNPEDAKNLYKPIMINHPWCVWARSGRQNAGWLWHVIHHLNTAYRARFHKASDHRSFLIAHRAATFIPLMPNIATFDTMTGNGMPICVPEEYILRGFAFTSYCNYYRSEKMRFARWNHSPIPEIFSAEYYRINYQEAELLYEDTVRV